MTAQKKNFRNIKLTTFSTSMNWEWFTENRAMFTVAIEPFCWMFSARFYLSIV